MVDGIDELFQRGCATYTLPTADRLLLSQTLTAAYDFFQLDEDTKRRDYLPGLHLGYRFSGIEYSATPDRPDLNDSLNISSGWRQTVPATSAAMSFYVAADRLLAALDRSAQRILEDVARRYPGEHPAPETADHSWLQVNYYRTFSTMRDVLQDKHEDGHLLTLWHSRTPGLEIFPGGGDAGSPITVEEGEMLVMPGALLTMLTGGDVAPLHHQVVRTPVSDERMALMYFVNPTTERALFPYKAVPGTELVDIAAVGARNPENYGLPQLKTSTDA